MAINNKILYENQDGSVGIGTSSPSAALSVQYNPALKNGFELIDSRDPDCRVLFTAACGELGFYTSKIGSFSAANLALSVDTSQLRQYSFELHRQGQRFRTDVFL